MNYRDQIYSSEDKTDTFEIAQCYLCNELEILYYTESLESIIDPDEKIYATPNTRFQISKEQSHLVLRFLKVLESKIQEEVYCITKILAIDRKGNLKIVLIKKSFKSHGGNIVLPQINSFKPFSLIAFYGLISQQDVLFSQRQFSDTQEIVIVPASFHIHSEDNHQFFPKWANLKVSCAKQVKEDQLKGMNFKNYNMIGILQHIDIQMLSNFQSELRNSEAFMILVDDQLVQFKVKAWGSAAFFINLKIQDILYFSNFSIHSFNEDEKLSLISIGYSQIVKDPIYMNPDAFTIIKSRIPSIFLKSVDQLIDAQLNVQLVITGCKASSIDFSQEKVEVIFEDQNQYKLKVKIWNQELADKLKSEDIFENRQDPFNIVLKAHQGISLYELTNSPFIELDAEYINQFNC